MDGYFVKKQQEINAENYVFFCITACNVSFRCHPVF